jgi:hypothetical protein
MGVEKMQCLQLIPVIIHNGSARWYLLFNRDKL